jgi:hypothetical protein
MSIRYRRGNLHDERTGERFGLKPERLAAEQRGSPGCLDRVPAFISPADLKHARVHNSLGCEGGS